MGAVSPLVINPSQAWDGNDGPWSSFTLGFGTPPQYVRMLISTTGYQPYVVLPDGCISSDPPDCGSRRGGLFRINGSTTWQDQGFYELGEELNLNYTGNGDFGSDTISLGLLGTGAPSVTGQIVVGIATKDFYVGSWGINPKPTNLSDFNDPQQSLLTTLKEKNLIPSLSYGYTAGARYRLKQVLGSLTLGGYDASRFAPSNLSFGFASDISRDLVVGIHSITADSLGRPLNPAELLPTPILSFIDAAVPEIWLPLAACEAFEQAFGLQWDSTTELYLVNETQHTTLLAQNASITFEIGTDTTNDQTVNIILPYASFDLEVSHPVVENATKYFPIRRAANETQYTLGRTFLQEAYLIVDYEQSNFSVNPCIFSESAQQDILPILAPYASPTDGTGASPEQPPPQPPRPARSISGGAIAGIAVAAIVVILLLFLGSFLALRRRRERASKESLHKAPTDEAQEKAELPYADAPQELHDSDNQKLELDGMEKGPQELPGSGGLKYELDGKWKPAEMSSPTPAAHELPGN
ncbi:hypothetical protein MMC24_000800 [Lignoscripta atroalba]|nr:hypothetical protein [Lignoscripta atroalba]